LISADLCYC